MQPIQIFNQPPRSPQQQPQQPRSLLTPTPGVFDRLTPPSVPTAAARLLVSVGGGIVTGAIGRVIPWGAEAIALALILALALVIGLGFLWRADRRGCWIALAYALFGAIGAGIAVGFGGES